MSRRDIWRFATQRGLSPAWVALATADPLNSSRAGGRGPRSGKVGTRAWKERTVRDAD